MAGISKLNKIKLVHQRYKCYKKRTEKLEEIDIEIVK